MQFSPIQDHGKQDAKENQRLGNEEEAKIQNKLLQEIQAQAKVTIILSLVGGIDVITHVLQIVTYAVTETLVGSNKKIYVLLFSDRCQLFSIPNTGKWLIHEEDKKQVTKLDGLLLTMDYPSSQQSWHFTPTTTSKSN